MSESTYSCVNRSNEPEVRRKRCQRRVLNAFVVAYRADDLHRQAQI